MRTNPCRGMTGLAVVCSLAAGGTASAQRLNYTDQTDVYVTVEYFDLPGSTQLFLLNEISGVKFAALVPLVSGDGTMSVPIPSGPGHYYVLAQQAGDWVARTVRFYTE
jgi:hypothetical protein